MVLGNIYSEKVTDDMPWSCEITNGWTDGLALEVCEVSDSFKVNFIPIIRID
jgi:hypothetical protein